MLNQVITPERTDSPRETPVPNIVPHPQIAPQEFPAETEPATSPPPKGIF